MKTKPATTIKVKSVSIPIYESATHGYQARFYDQSGKRQRWGARDLDKLKERCRKRAKEMAAHAIDLTTLDQDQLAVVREVVRRGITLSDLEGLNDELKPITVAEAIEQFLAEKKDDSDGSLAHYRTLRTHLGQFGKKFGKRQLISITKTEIKNYLRAIKVKKTRANHRGSLTNLFTWGQDNEHLHEERVTAAKRTPAVKQAKTKKVDVWTPEQLEKMLAVVPHPYLPWLVIQAFAGVRTEEMFPDISHGATKPALDWSDVKLGRKSPVIIVEAEVSKTKRRVIPICDTLAEWLRPIAKKSGRITPNKMPGRRNHKEKTVTEILAEAVGTKWKKNAMRHSFGSYRTAQTQDMPRVSLEMGNSVATIDKHYHEAQEEEEAEAWFALAPSKVDRKLRIAG